MQQCNNVYYARKKVTIGYTCILKYNACLQNYVNNINEKILATLHEMNVADVYQPYDDNLHITLLGLDPSDNFLKDSKKIIELLGDFTSINIQEIMLKLEADGLIIMELEVDDNSQELLKNYRQKLEKKYQIEYKYKQNIRKMHSVIGIFNYDNLQKLSTSDLQKIFSKISDLLTTVESINFKDYQDRQLANPLVVKYNVTDLKGYKQIAK